MKLTRYHQDEKIIPGVYLDDTTILNCELFGEDWCEHFFENDGLERLRTFVQEKSCLLPTVDSSEVQLAPAIARPSKIICIGLNYADHAKESGLEEPAEPVVFFKATTAWCGPNDDLILPRGSLKTDWEVELAVVIGQKAQYISIEEAPNYIAGYGLHNDYSERAWQLEGTGQWVKGKSADTYAPFGPFLATPDEIKDPNNLRLWLSVNGENKQDGNSSNLIFDINTLISYLSQYMTLLPGDVISTGTPAGVGLGFTPPQYLRAGDIVELGIEGLGKQKQTVV